MSLHNLTCGLVCVPKRKCELVVKIALVFKSLKYVLSDPDPLGMLVF